MALQSTNLNCSRQHLSFCCIIQRKGLTFHVNHLADDLHEMPSMSWKNNPKKKNKVLSATVLHGALRLVVVLCPTTTAHVVWYKNFQYF